MEQVTGRRRRRPIGDRCRWCGTPSRRSGALLAVTVVGGFASTIFLPLTGLLVDRYGWRAALLILAAIQFALTVPALAVVTVHLVAALIDWGHPATFAATTAGLFGILSVTGRLTSTGLQRRYRTATVTAAIFAVQAVAAAALPLAGRHAVPVVIVGFGLGFGVGTIAKPVLLADRYDIRRYATIAGLLVVPVTAAKATMPLAAAWLHTAAGGYGTVFLGTAGLCLIAAAALLAVSRTAAPGESRRPTAPTARAASPGRGRTADKAGG